MNRIAQLDPNLATGKAKQLLTGVQGKLGVVPNLFRVLSNSPAALEGYLNFGGALASGVLSAKIREQISLAVAEINYCGYCLSAHTYLGGKAGLSTTDIANARKVAATDPHTEAILSLARSIVVQRGELSATEFEAARAAGLTDAEIVETVANVAVNIFTNYINHVAQTVVDFPEVKPGELEPTAQVA
ncbi:MAG TPA: carboxymuconolactone decarboxylase family protein [Candidatus Limnocylindria bacterium]|jgi:uncharacterized peroxidase-related enzyme|nr:carboxymuconolactone decarboxylase family protein [Candidatus Limnocylindria bacterium]